MTEAARKDQVQGSLPAIAVRVSCRACGRSHSPSDRLCPHCQAPGLPLPEFWWIGVPERALAAQVHLANSGEDWPPQEGGGFIAEDEGAVLLIQAKAPPRGWMKQYRYRPPSKAPSLDEAGGGIPGVPWRSLDVGDRWRISIAAPGGVGGTFWEVMPERVAPEAGVSPERLRIQRVSLSRGGSMTFVLGEGSRASLVAKVPLSGRALARCEENMATLSAVRRGGSLPVGAEKLLPRALGRVDVLDHAVFVETALPGTAWREGMGRLRRRSSRRLAAAFLRDLHAATSRFIVFDDDGFEDRVGHYFDRLAGAFGRSTESDTVLGMKEDLRGMLQERRWPVVLEHGDFHLGNCLFETSPWRLSGVIDWDLGSPSGLPVLDLLHLLITTETPGRIDDGTARKLLDWHLSSDAKRLVREYLVAIGLAADAVGPFVYLYLLVKVLVTFLVREGDSKERWRTEVVLPALAAIKGAR